MFTTVLCDTAMLSLVPFMVKFIFRKARSNG
jgi:hypothetical protein